MSRQLVVAWDEKQSGSRRRKSLSSSSRRKSRRESQQSRSRSRNQQHKSKGRIRSKSKGSRRASSKKGASRRLRGTTTAMVLRTERKIERSLSRSRQASESSRVRGDDPESSLESDLWLAEEHADKIRLQLSENPYLDAKSAVRLREQLRSTEFEIKARLLALKQQCSELNAVDCEQRSKYCQRKKKPRRWWGSSPQGKKKEKAAECESISNPPELQALATELINEVYLRALRKRALEDIPAKQRTKEETEELASLRKSLRMVQEEIVQFQEISRTELAVQELQTYYEEEKRRCEDHIRAANAAREKGLGPDFYTALCDAARLKEIQKHLDTVREELRTTTESMLEWLKRHRSHIAWAFVLVMGLVGVYYVLTPFLAQWTELLKASAPAFDSLTGLVKSLGGLTTILSLGGTAAICFFSGGIGCLLSAAANAVQVYVARAPAVV